MPDRELVSIIAVRETCAMRRFARILAVLGLCGIPAIAQIHAPINPPALYEKGMNALTGTGFSRSDLTGVDYIRQSADLGYAPAQSAMGYFEEVGFFAPREPEQAAAHYAKAAAQGDRVAEWVLGRMYFTGIGQARNLGEAERWLTKAANLGDPFGAELLGSVKLERNDKAAAASAFRKAAEQGLPFAQQQLGLLLKDGQGVPIDKSEAYVWLLLSFDGGIQATVNDLKQLEAELGNTKVETAKTRSRELEANVSRTVVSRGCTGWQGELASVPATPPPDLQPFCR